MKPYFDLFHHSYDPFSYRYLGSHFEDENQPDVVSFRVYAPHATRVCVVGDFNGWQIGKAEMKRITDGGIWEIKIDQVKEFDRYKYYIENKNKKIFKQDPYGYHFETDRDTCTKVIRLKNRIQDQDYQMQKQDLYHCAMNIYEVNLLSWKRYKNNTPFNYRKLAKELLPYVKKMGYTHIEIMPLMEHPFAGSWGYQVTGYFGITSRMGTPDDFMAFVEEAHRLHIGVILDWVPAHFAKDDFGLIEFDGDFVYEDPDPTRMEHEGWGTRIFNYGKPEVKSFLISSALFYMDYYHIDGLRVDAVASMLYLDYDRKVWKKNQYGGNHHLEAIEFLKNLNQEVFRHYPHALMIAEESTDFVGITKPVYSGGLGFNFKWNMGWMNDTLKYIQKDPYFRRELHHKMTFSLMYAFNENFILPLSHDEVVHGKRSLIEKMPGDYDMQFANLRAYYGFLMTHPGKKLTFMGTEFAQFIEWNENQELDWFLLDYPKHQVFHHFVRTMNRLYKHEKALWELDTTWQGFKWIVVDDGHHDLFVYQRFSQTKQEILVMINFSGVDIPSYTLPLTKGTYQLLLSSDDAAFGGQGRKVEETKKLDKTGWECSIPALSVLIYKKR